MINLALGSILAQATNPPATAAPNVASVQIHSVWDWIVKGGPVMVPIIACSLVALAVIAERSITLRRRKVIPAEFLPGLHAKLAMRGGDGSFDREAALNYCLADKSPVAVIFAAGIRRLGEPIERLEKHIEEAGQREILALRKNLRVLSVVASVSTLLGLLGTIFGMITAFATVAASAEALGKTELLAKGIYEAMITTAAGLLVCIPATICYHMIAAHIERLVAEMDRMTVDFLEKYGRADAPRAGAPLSGAPEIDAVGRMGAIQIHSGSSSADGNGDGAKPVSSTSTVG